LLCWFANAGAREAALRHNLNLIVTHETPFFETPSRDPGCPPPADWLANKQTAAFYDNHGIAVARYHRTLDAFCIPRAVGAHLGFPPPSVHEGHKGYEFTLVYDLEPTPFEQLARQVKEKMKLPAIRLSAGDGRRTVRRVGLGWGGVSLSANLQYMELLRQHGAEVIIGGEVDEYALEYYRESGMDWIELGHYATEAIGLEQVARELGATFASTPLLCHKDSQRLVFL